MLVFTGDVNITDNNFDYGYGVGSSVKKGLNPFSKILRNHQDYWVGNFEGVSSKESNKRNFRYNVFRIAPKYINCISFFNSCSLANNHSMEHGSIAFEEMKNALNELGVFTFGDIENKSQTFVYQNRKISITGISFRNDLLEEKPLYWNFPDYKQIEIEFNKIKDSDHKIAYLHWGVEFIHYPYKEQVLFAHWLVDLGYDLIIGMHPHVLQGYEIYKGKHIFYSLGNFVFNMEWNHSKYGAIVKYDVNNGNVQYYYIHINNHYQPEIIDESKVPKELTFPELNKMFDSYKNIENYMELAKKGLKAYRRANYKSLIINTYKRDLNFTLSILKNFLQRRLKY